MQLLKIKFSGFAGLSLDSFVLSQDFEVLGNNKNSEI